MSLKDVIYHIYLIKLDEIINKLDEMSFKYKNIPMLSRTHGQPASPTTIGKEIYVISGFSGYNISFILDKLFEMFPKIS